PQIYSQGYADDIVLLSRGIDSGTIHGIAQDALEVTSNWCRTVDLRVCASKVVAMLFTRRNKITLSPLLLDGQEIELKNGAKYLGISFDPKLTWKQHCLNKARSDSVALFQCRRAVRRKWGWTPRVCIWIYTA